MISPIVKPNPPSKEEMLEYVSKFRSLNEKVIKTFRTLDQSKLVQDNNKGGLSHLVINFYSGQNNLVNSIKDYLDDDDLKGSYKYLIKVSESLDSFVNNKNNTCLGSLAIKNILDIVEENKKIHADDPELVKSLENFETQVNETIDFHKVTAALVARIEPERVVSNGQGKFHD